MLELGAEIQVPADHAAERRTSSSPELAAGPDVLLPLLQIQSGTLAPGDAFAAIKYRNYWYWIDMEVSLHQVRAPSAPRDRVS